MTNYQALIIDDNVLNSDVLITLIQNAGLDAVALDSPRYLEDAIEHLSDLQVIFLDLEFPNHSGFDLLKQLKSNPHLQNVPIVAYSVHTSEIDKVRKAGFHSFVGKPLDPKRFPSQLERILNNQAVWEV